MRTTVKVDVGDNCQSCRWKKMECMSPYCMLFPERDLKDSYERCKRERSYE